MTFRNPYPTLQTMQRKKYIIERRDKNGQLITSYEDLPEKIQWLVKKQDITLMKLVYFANDFECTWHKSEFGHEVGTISPNDIDTWLSKWGLKRRLITWR